VGEHLKAGSTSSRCLNEAFTDRLFLVRAGTVHARGWRRARWPGVSEQIAASGVRYVVWLDGTRRPTAVAAYRGIATVQRAALVLAVGKGIGL
jgi:hypothetical protein